MLLAILAAWGLAALWISVFWGIIETIAFGFHIRPTKPLSFLKIFRSGIVYLILLLFWLVVVPITFEVTKKFKDSFIIQTSFDLNEPSISFEQE